MMHGREHHVSILKRNDKEQPISNFVLNETAYVLGIVGPFVSLPQLYSVWIQHDVTGVSIASWSAFTILSVFWWYYGIRHHEKPLMISQFLWAVMNLAVVIGVFVYR